MGVPNTWGLIMWLGIALSLVKQFDSLSTASSEGSSLSTQFSREQKASFFFFSSLDFTPTCLVFCSSPVISAPQFCTALFIAAVHVLRPLEWQWEEPETKSCVKRGIIQPQEPQPAWPADTTPPRPSLSHWGVGDLQGWRLRGNYCNTFILRIIPVNLSHLLPNYSCFYIILFLHITLSCFSLIRSSTCSSLQQPPRPPPPLVYF